jgi:hypothetical protein
MSGEGQGRLRGMGADGEKGERETEVAKRGIQIAERR